MTEGQRSPVNHDHDSFPANHADVTFVGRPFPLEDAPDHFARLRRWGLTFSECRFSLSTLYVVCGQADSLGLSKRCTDCDGCEPVLVTRLEVRLPKQAPCSIGSGCWVDNPSCMARSHKFRNYTLRVVSIALPPQHYVRIRKIFSTLTDQPTVRFLITWEAVEHTAP